MKNTMTARLIQLSAVALIHVTVTAILPSLFLHHQCTCQLMYMTVPSKKGILYLNIIMK